MEPTFVKCSLCKAMVKPANLKKHKRKIHSKTSTTQPPEPPLKIFTKTSYKCNQCSKKFPKSRLLSHLQEKHDFYPKNTENIHLYYFTEVKESYTRSSTNSKTGSSAPKKPLKDPNESEFKTSYNQMNKESDKKVKIPCSICKKKVKKSGLANHFAMRHGSNLKTLQDLRDSINKENAKISQNPDFDGERSEDVYDRNKVISGGAYGLGKNRKH